MVLSLAEGCEALRGPKRTEAEAQALGLEPVRGLRLTYGIRAITYETMTRLRRGFPDLLVEGGPQWHPVLRSTCSSWIKGMRSAAVPNGTV